MESVERVEKIRYQQSRTLIAEVYGDCKRTACPLCESTALSTLWRLPMVTVSPPLVHEGSHYTQLPCLKTPHKLYNFDLCQHCECIFLNPFHLGLKENYRKSKLYLHDDHDLAPYEARFVQHMLPFVPKDARVMLDAPSGLGHYLTIAS